MTTPFVRSRVTYTRLNKNTPEGLLSCSLRASDHINCVLGERQNRYNLPGLLAIRRESSKVPAPVRGTVIRLIWPTYNSHKLNNLSPIEIPLISESATDNGLKRTQAYNKNRSKGSSAVPKYKFFAFPQPQNILSMVLNFGHFSASCSDKKKFL